MVSKELEIKRLANEVARLEKAVDKWGYNNGRTDAVGKEMAEALSLLTKARLKLHDAAFEQIGHDD